ncbi:MAG: hypothetical protein HQL30_04510 [Candidatus Omnitrophica bacterium]|nr:hypothetical protein [Candidatus Omnitrophota bacterium]
MKNQNKRKNVFANKMHQDILLLVLVSSLAPTVLVTISLYFLIFGITANQIGIPESIAYNVLPAAQKVVVVLAIAMPILILTILFFAHKISHMIVGPFDRIVRELGECVTGTKKTHIYLRDNDKFWPMVSAINKLLDKANSK